MSEQTTERDVDSAVIDSGTVVTFHYDLYDGDANKIESSRTSDEPIVVLFGDGSVLAAMWDALRDKRAGEDLTITLPSAQAYGRHYPDRVQRVALKKLGLKGRALRPGQLVRLPGSRDKAPATVLKTGKFSVDVDTNHPLAGQDLTFDISIVAVREASDSERAHGHVHGPGGHAH